MRRVINTLKDEVSGVSRYLTCGTFPRSEFGICGRHGAPGWSRRSVAGVAVRGPLAALGRRGAPTGLSLRVGARLGSGGLARGEAGQ